MFPRRCPVCDKPVAPFGAYICEKCEGTVKYVTGATCYKCGKPLENESDEFCEDCTKHKHLYIQGKAVFEYKSVSDSLYRFKYKGREEYAVWYGLCISHFLGTWLKKISPDALIPVPIHKSKMKSRGYNQAALLARELSKHTGIPVLEDCVERIKKTTPLKDLTPLERNNILRGSFKLKANVVKLRTIVIIDDIYTTGSTIDAVAKPFLEAGIGKIYFVTLAIGRGV